MLTNLPSWIHTAIMLINFYKHIIYAMSFHKFLSTLSIYAPLFPLEKWITIICLILKKLKVIKERWLGTS